MSNMAERGMLTFPFYSFQFNNVVEDSAKPNKKARTKMLWKQMSLKSTSNRRKFLHNLNLTNKLSNSLNSNLSNNNNNLNKNNNNNNNLKNNNNNNNSNHNNNNKITFKILTLPDSQLKYLF